MKGLIREPVHEYPRGLEGFRYVLVVEKADMSAHQYISSQRIAGFVAESIKHLVLGIAKKTQALHSKNLVHLDLSKSTNARCNPSGVLPDKNNHLLLVQS